jgi:hypothetical protein
MVRICDARKKEKVVVVVVVVVVDGKRSVDRP